MTAFFVVTSAVTLFLAAAALVMFCQRHPDPVDTHAAQAALDPRDSADLPAGDEGPCQVTPFIAAIYDFLKEQAK